MPPREQALPWIGLLVRLVAAAIWLVAGAAKIADLETFKTQVAAYDVLPHGLVGPFAYGLPFVEVAIGLYLAFGFLVRPAAALATFLMLVFIAAEAQAWARGLRLDCGCFGALAKQSVGPWTIVRDVAFGIPSLLLLIRPARRLSLDRRLLQLPDRFAGQAS